MRICSLVPSASEILFELELDDEIVCATHACDYPSKAKTKLKVTKSIIDVKNLSSREIDEEGESLYIIDEEVLRSAKPDICDVCAVLTIEDILDSIKIIASRTDRMKKAKDIIKYMIDKIEEIEKETKNNSYRPNVLCLERIEPLFIAEGEHSYRTNWKFISEIDPDIIIIMPCGFDDIFKNLRAVKQGNVHIVDANAYFSSPSPRFTLKF